MFQLRDEHVAALAPLFRESFEQAAIDEIRSLIPEQVEDEDDEDLRERVQACALRAMPYGLTRNDDIVSFAIASYVFGDDFDADADAPAGKVLRSDEVPIAEKGDLLRLGALQAVLPDEDNDHTHEED